MRLEFIENGPALIVENRERTLVVADLHFGIEFDLASQGWHFRSRSKDRLERVLAITHEHSPDRIILLGDVKHGVPITSRQEFRELPAILERLRTEAELRIAPGNHDGGLERFTEPGEMLPMNGSLVDGVGYLHGHTYPDPSLLGNLMISGHHHPFVFLKDEVGCALQSPAYLLASLDGECLKSGKDLRETRRNAARKKNRGDLADESETPVSDTSQPESDLPPESRKEIRALFIPAFNEFAGLDVLRIWRDPTSPLTRCMIGERSEVFLADGTPLGLLPSLGGEENDRSRA